MAKKRRSGAKNYGKGDFCVFTSTGKKVRCYESKATAERVAKAFSANPRINLSYRVKKKDK
jgi:hypothetical protein